MLERILWRVQCKNHWKLISWISRTKFDSIRTWICQLEIMKDDVTSNNPFFSSLRERKHEIITLKILNKEIWDDYIKRVIRLIVIEINQGLIFKNDWWNVDVCHQKSFIAIGWWKSIKGKKWNIWVCELNWSDVQKVNFWSIKIENKTSILNFIWIIDVGQSDVADKNSEETYWGNEILIWMDSHISNDSISHFKRDVQICRSLNQSWFLKNDVFKSWIDETSSRDSSRCFKAD